MIHVVGRRKPRPVARKASAALLKQGAAFNDGLRKLPTGQTTFFPKGIYRYATHEEANDHWIRCVVAGMSKHAKR